ncbi:hypothetical protein GCM10011492_42200 [Flexivirga endophytica]|uniref:YCII-related domain-containing protein n=1 Tax=Flexivirga endophytica TaxID=1849103 RepID=A0A916TJA4_9MICO|nr:YciI family protein [Flexivirga endophytica]GGB46666.1 hypothetical protein GCM10011492_42200 [Flexivirga endophytica]GHB70700.1 hypothetical protein GCM10008112_43910 [Flexivirga endophytica]
MNFFCFHRDRVGSGVLRDELREEHWSYMDRFAGQLIARGPTFNADGAVTGSVHVVRTTNAAEARAFAFEEPYYQAGVFRDVLLRRWENLLGRTMWQFPNPREDAHRYLVLGLGGQRVGHASDQTSVIACGPLLSDDGGRSLGAAALVQIQDPRVASAVLFGGDGTEAEVHRWDFGGRPSDG